jgi:NTE family protein
MSTKKLGLALGSGSWRGLAHIGVIKSLVKNDIPIDYISGCSIGSIIGGLYAALGDIKEIEKIADSLSFKTFFKSVLPRPRRRSLVFNGKFDQFFGNILGNIKIEDLKIPYCAIGSDLMTGELIVINKGSLVTAMKASSAIPVFFNPVNYEDKKVLDGGLISPVPVKEVRTMGADVVLGVSLYGGAFPVKLDPKHKLTRLKAGKISRFLSLQTLADINLKSADVTLDLKIPNEDYGFFSQFSNSKELINCGTKSAANIIPLLKDKLNL